MTPQDLHALAFGFVSGALILMTGVGAGVIVVPGLIALFGLPPTLAVGTASMFSVLTRIMAAFEHLPLDKASRRLLVDFAKLSIPATLLTALTINFLLGAFPAWSAVIQKTLKMAVVIAAACAMAMMFLEGLNAAMRRSGRHALPVFTGTLIGATGIGGGVLIVPALMAASNEPLKRIIGTSVILGLVLSLITGAVYGASGALDWRITLWMTAGALLAMPIAGRLFRRMTEQQVRRLSALVIGLSITGLIIDLIVHR